MTDTDLLEIAIKGYQKDIKELEKAYKPITKITDAKTKSLLQEIILEKVLELNGKIKRYKEFVNLLKKEAEAEDKA